MESPTLSRMISGKAMVLKRRRWNTKRQIRKPNFLTFGTLQELENRKTESVLVKDRFFVREMRLPMRIKMLVLLLNSRLFDQPPLRLEVLSDPSDLEATDPSLFKLCLQLQLD